LNRIYYADPAPADPGDVDFFLADGKAELQSGSLIRHLDKATPAQAKRAAMAFWSALPQFNHTKFVVRGRPQHSNP